jgi:hypothetical protein
MAVDEPQCKGCGEREQLIITKVSRFSKPMRVSSEITVTRPHLIVDHHCVPGHHDTQSDLQLDWDEKAWPGPKECSCGVTSPY